MPGPERQLLRMEEDGHATKCDRIYNRGPWECVSRGHEAESCGGIRAGEGDHVRTFLPRQLRLTSPRTELVAFVKEQLPGCDAAQDVALASLLLETERERDRDWACARLDGTERRARVGEVRHRVRPRASVTTVKSVIFRAIVRRSIPDKSDEPRRRIAGPQRRAELYVVAVEPSQVRIEDGLNNYQRLAGT